MSDNRSHRQSFISLTIYFISYGLLVNTLYSRQPALQKQYDLDAADWGWVLFLVGLGSVLAYPVCRYFLGKWGSKRMCRRFGGLQALWLILLAYSPNVTVLYTALFFAGMLNSAVGIAINAQGALLESNSGKRQMGQLHAVFYVGSFITAALSSLSAKFNVPLGWHFGVLAFVMWFIYILVGSRLVGDFSPNQKKVRERGGWKTVLPVGVLTAFASITEGAITGWSILYLNKILGASESEASLGFAIFSLAMMSGRFLGDHVAERFGAATVVRFGAWMGAAVLIASVIIHQPNALLFGLVLIGLGHSACFPLIYSYVGKKGGNAVAKVVSMGFVGSLIGPIVFGRIAKLVSLDAVMISAAIALFIMGCLAFTIRDKHRVAKPA